MPMKLRVIRPYRNGNMIYDTGAIIEPPAAVGEVLRNRGICVPANDSECRLRPTTPTGAETAKAPEPEVPTKRKRTRHAPVTPPEVKHGDDDAKRTSE